VDDNSSLINQGSGNQGGDQSYGSVAGRDIHNQGADANAVLDFLRRYVFEADQRRETALKELNREIRLSRDDMAIMGDALRTVRDRVDDIIVNSDADKLDREDRQGELDRALAALREEQRRMRRVLFWGGVALLVALLVGAWLLVDRFTALAMLRVWAGAGVGVAWAILRGR
jgi:hypothetical protein